LGVLHGSDGLARARRLPDCLRRERRAAGSDLLGSCEGSMAAAEPRPCHGILDCLAKEQGGEVLWLVLPALLVAGTIAWWRRRQPEL